MSLQFDLEQHKKLIEVNDKLTQLHWIVAQVSGENDLKTMYNLIINGFMQIAEVPGCQFVLLNEEYKPVEIISRGISQQQSGYCPGLDNSIQRTLGFPKSLESSTCENCRSSCGIEQLKSIVLYGRNGNPLAIIYAFYPSFAKQSEEANTILELFTIQVSLALENAILNKKLQDLSVTDSLTGLYNHRFFAEAYRQQINICHKINREMCLIMLDVDQFKSYNDTYGHPAGDVVLQTLGKVFRSIARPKDVVARYGGEEFAFILPDTNLSQGLAFAKEIQQTLAKTPIPHRTVTASIGIAHYPSHTSNAADLLELADHALYYAKAHGRNKIVSA